MYTHTHIHASHVHDAYIHTCAPSALPATEISSVCSCCTLHMSLAYRLRMSSCGSCLSYSYIHTCMCTCIQTSMHAYSPWMSSYASRVNDACLHVYMHACTHRHKRIHPAHAHMHACTPRHKRIHPDTLERSSGIESNHSDANFFFSKKTKNRQVSLIALGCSLTLIIRAAPSRRWEPKQLMSNVRGTNAEVEYTFNSHFSPNQSP